MKKILESMVIVGIGGCIVRVTYVLGRERGFKKGVETGKTIEKLTMLNDKINEYLNKNSKEETES